MNAYTDVATRPGPSSGNVTRQKAIHRLQPSTMAACSRSSGMPLMKPRSVHTVTAA